MAGDRISGNPDQILQAIVRQLIDSIDDQTSESCFISQHTDEVPPINPGAFAITVRLDQAKFDDTLIDGGGNLQLTYLGQVIVKVYSFLQLDEIGRDAVALTDATRGLLAKAKQVLQALSLFDPTDANLDYMLREPMFPNTFNVPSHDRDVTPLELSFSIIFDWDMS